jgi:exopolyphosphatase/guanosine-5'-triphosphate,3'-diphosphate pyrophosphatase
MPSLTAVVDLGTNTFHILIMEWEGRQFTILEKLQIPVKLGKGAFGSHLIKDDAFERGINAIKEYKKLIDKYQVSEVAIYGTSVLRNAVNGPLFVAEAQNIIGYPINIIGGEEEAELIYMGVRNAVPLGAEPHLIMDIGGGSVEFIIGDEKRAFWMKSYEIGAGRLVERFSKNDPIDKESISGLESYLETELSELWAEASNFKLNTLVGASGSFESIASMERKIYGLDKKSAGSSFHVVNMFHFNELFQKIVSSTQSELRNVPGLPEFRVEMISVALILVNHVMRRLNLKRMVTSDYALKEGVMYKLMLQHSISNQS